MVHVFYNQRGSGKTKALISLANEKALNAKGDLVYIDADNRSLLHLDRKIRLIPAKDYKLKNYENFYGFLCGVLSEDYDIDTVFVDGFGNIVKEDLENAAHLFFDMENLAQENGVEFYINISSDNEDVPEFMKKYKA